MERKKLPLEWIQHSVDGEKKADRMPLLQGGVGDIDRRFPILKLKGRSCEQDADV